MGVDAWGFPGGLLRLDPAFAYVEPPSSWPLSRAEYLTLAPNNRLKTMQRYREKMAMCKPGRETSEDASSADTLVLDCQTLELWENEQFNYNKNNIDK